MKKIFILGSTGSIGVNTLNVIRDYPDLFRVSGITANSNIDLLMEQVEEFKPEWVVISDKSAAKNFALRSSDKIEILEGEEGLITATKNADYDILLSALVGFAGLSPTIEGIKRRKRIALANKETLVVAGEFIMDLAKKYFSEIIPVDSEHSAIFQCLAGEKTSEVGKLILTASGGPFLENTFEDLKSVSVADALNHPNWDMGNKISIDSASMMNKGLEVIEAHWLFNLPKNQIDVVIHPQSIIHSMVEFVDGSIKAQLSKPDMKLPIIYALSYPNRLQNNYTQTDLCKISKLTFFEPDFRKFECLKIAFDVMQIGGTAPCIMNAANEIAVEMFLNEKIKFLDIPKVISESLDKIEKVSHPDIETIFECDRKTRELALTYN
ncbi:MAG: 1-deoxy-D-xylulose-5-phosphate reductoisomerase [Ignavibacteriae bacterium HGW-Ignavibacteriae-2]|jgi:1-deoxy-D-xylulose-5-phosphate reductoisomerase|nr:MAG: 1-deoxy-D-xylulose-5-phosphate reductoisomerase [Ignavibacteriae bacterium HGW-Ignavibacteriae-2]